MKRDGWRLALAQRGIAGAKAVLDRLAGFGWCEVSPYEEGVRVEWEGGAEPLLRTCGDRDADKRSGIHLARLCLLLDLLGQQVPPGFSAGIVSSERGTAWSARVLCEVGRGRYRPAWWDLDRSWHEMVRAGDIRMPIFYPWVVEEGLWQTAQRLAELGWVDFGSCDLGGSGYYMLNWREDLAGLMSLVLAPSAAAGVGGPNPDFHLEAVGRLSLLLQLKLMRAPSQLQAELIAGTSETQAWVSALAVRAARGLHPLWWDRGVAWHAAVRQGLVNQQVRAGLLDAGE